MGGGTPFAAVPTALSAGLSPRGRGNLFPNGARVGLRRSIPAWAGEPLYLCSQAMAVSRVYPRVGGGTSLQPDTEYEVQGLSPRGRGNLVRSIHRHCYHRSIPAWAGEPY